MREGFPIQQYRLAGEPNANCQLAARHIHLFLLLCLFASSPNAVGQVELGDISAIAFDANVVKTVSALPWAAFGDETESIKSGARAEICLEKEEFLARSKKMQTATAGLLEAAKTGDQAKLKVAFGDTARSCKACHDAYKE